MKKLLLGILFLFIFIPSTYAADAEFVCGESACSPSSISSFLPNIAWYPGKSISKTVTIQNTTTKTRTIQISPNNTNSIKNLDSVVSMKIFKSPNTLIWNGTLNHFFSRSADEISTIPANSSMIHTYIFTMDQQAGNEYQDASTNFDLVLKLTDIPDNNGGNTGSGTITPTQTITPTPKDDSSLNSGSSNSSQNTSSSSSPSSDNQSTLGASVAQTISNVLAPVLNTFSQFDNGLDTQEEILGASESGDIKNETKKAENNKTASIAECTQNYNWIVILGIDILLILILKKFIKSKKAFIYSVIISLAALVGIYFIVCTKWYALLALLPLVIHLKSLKE